MTPDPALQSTAGKLWLPVYSMLRYSAANQLARFDPELHTSRSSEYSGPMTKPVIARSPDVMGGTPMFARTRVPVQTLLDYLEAGDSLMNSRRQDRASDGLVNRLERGTARPSRQRVRRLRDRR